MNDRPEHRFENASLAALLVAAILAVVAIPTAVAAGDSDDPSKAKSSSERPERIELVQADEQSESDASEESEDEERASTQSGSQLRRSDRMEFDARLIRGERASGAVFLFQRTPRRLPSMVERRRTYLEESVRSVLGSTWSRRFDERRSEATQTSSESTDQSKRDDADSSSDERSIIEEFSSEHD